MCKKLPRHIAIVMDGNGRWAENKGLLRIEGHRAGINSVKAAVQICLEKHIPILSLFAFSSENWSRPKEEVEFLMALFVQALDKEIQALHNYGVKVCFIGERCQLSPLLNQQMQTAEILTKNNTKLILNIAVNYSGKWDILQAAKLIANQALAGIINPEDINETFFADKLSTKGLPDPDLLIRTSGEERISNFFLWQLAYTELYFADVQWPDFTTEQFELALASFSGRERRYGQISKQLNENLNV